MINMIVAGVLGVFAALVGAQFGYDMILGGEAAGESGNTEDLTQLTTELTGVPIISNNEVLGYIVLRVSSVIDTTKLPDKDFDAAPFLVDAAFRSTYEFAEHGLTRILPSDLVKLSDEIRKKVNDKMGAEAVHQVNLEQFNFVKKSEVRGQMLEPH